jgi:hypothetical protein
MMTIDSSVDAGLPQRVLRDYREMPGLALTMAQACRLWGCDEATCHCTVDALVASGILRWSDDGHLVRRDIHSDYCKARAHWG